MKILITENQLKYLIKERATTEKDAQYFLNDILGIDLSQFLKPTQSPNNIETPTSDDSNIKMPTVKSSKQTPTDKEGWLHPLGKKSKITSRFGWRLSKIGSKYHKGIDISAPSGSPVYAPQNGIVIAARDTTPNGCGGFISLYHTEYGLYTKYCHLRQWIVKPNDKVNKGQIIGYTGGGTNDPYKGTSSGPHLHYQITDSNGIAQNPINIHQNLV
jgi:murein DD-endopeptidase MepM/ murein hydrolase activator NlpD